MEECMCSHSVREVKKELRARDRGEPEQIVIEIIGGSCALCDRRRGESVYPRISSRQSRCGSSQTRVLTVNAAGRGHWTASPV